jgi:hypothetical protein
MMDAVATSMDLKRTADALERIANMLEQIGVGWGNADPTRDWQRKPWPRCAPIASDSIHCGYVYEPDDSSKGKG